MPQLYLDFKTAYDLVRREVLYNILTEFDIPMETVRLINLLKTKRNLLYIRNQFVPRSRNLPPRL